MKLLLLVLTAFILTASERPGWPHTAAVAFIVLLAVVGIASLLIGSWKREAEWADLEPLRGHDMAEGFQRDLELDRIDNELGYGPDNCRWATRIEQQRNRRNNHRIECNGRTLTLQEWAEERGIKANTILTRLRRGWAVDRALELANGDSTLERNAVGWRARANEGSSQEVAG